MFVKTKERAGRTTYFLCIAESGGSSWKAVEYSVCLGETLDLSGARWAEILRRAPEFRSVLLADVLEVMEGYAREHGLRSEVLDGLREAVRASRGRKPPRGEGSERRAPQGQRVEALRVLGLRPGSSDREIERAFRKAARRLHPDVGGDPAKFRALLEARNFLLGRAAQPGEIG